MAPIYALGSIIIILSVFSTKKAQGFTPVPANKFGDYLSVEIISRTYDFFSRFELNFTVVSFLVIRFYCIAFH